MKTHKLLLCFSLFIPIAIGISFSPCSAQTWQWGQQGYGSVKTNDNGSPVATDKNGDVYLTGQFATIIVFGNILLNGNQENAYLVKYDNKGTVIWAKAAADSGYSYSFSTSIATDPDGDVFIAGRFSGSVAFGSYTLRSDISYSTFLVKYDDNGNVVWARQSTYGGIYYAAASAYAVTTDESGNAFIAGEFEDSLKFGSYKLTSPSSQNMFLTKYDANGNVKWAVQSTSNSTYNKYDYAYGMSVATDSYGNIFVTGLFEDTVTFGSKTLISVYPGYNQPANSVFLVKYSPLGNFFWAKQTENGSTNSVAEANFVVADKSGNSYITGYFQGTVNFDSYQVYSPFTYCAFLAKYDAGGNASWVKQSTPGWEGAGLATDASEHIYLSGMNYYQNLDTLAWGSYKLVAKPWTTNASYLIEFNNEGTPLCGTMLNNLGFNELKPDVTSDISGEYIYIGGTFANDTIDCGSDTLVSKGGGTNVFVGRWKPCTSAEVYPTGGGESYQSCIFVPNAFSPDNDHNNILYVRGSCINSLDFSVFDRWGNRIYETENINKGWDGTYRGQSMNMGTYVWYLKATLQDGSTVVQNGNVTLVR